MTDKLKKLQQIATGDARIELDLALAARDNTRAAYYESYDPADKTKMDAAADNLKRVIDELYGQLVETDRLYENVKAMLDDLKLQGYSISQGTIYKHAKEGSLRLEADRSITKQSFEAWKIHPDGGLKVMTLAEDAEESASADLKQLAKREKELDVDIKEENKKAKQLANRKEDRKWMLKADAYLQMAGQLGILQDSVDHHLTMGSSGLILAAGGDQEKAAEFGAMLKSLIVDAFNEVANSGRLEVLFESVDEDADDEYVA